MQFKDLKINQRFFLDVPNPTEWIKTDEISAKRVNGLAVNKIMTVSPTAEVVESYNFNQKDD